MQDVRGRAGTNLARGSAVGLVATALVAAVSVAIAPGASADDAADRRKACDRYTNNTYQKLLDCVTLDGVRAHQQALQDIAEANDDLYYPGTRAVGTEGYDESVDYVVGKLKRAGYKVTLDEFDFTFGFPAVLEQLTPVAATYPTGAFTGSGSADVTGTVIPVDVALAPPRLSSSGCETTDFDGLDFSGTADIALVQRGTCPFVTKALNAEAAGAEAVVIFNQGNDPTREDLIVGTLGGADVAAIPVVGASFGQGEALAAAGSTARVLVTPNEVRTSVNVIAELKGPNNTNVVMAGAHLDSVTEGPGINDNGSGSAAILETALQMRKVKPYNTIRFAFWGAEELGLIGSTAYVEGLSQAERDRIALYLNFDMVGSPNYIQTVYDSDQSTFEAPVPIPAGSTAIEDIFESFYTSVGEPYDDSEFSGRSDYQAFIDADIASGGLFTGAEGVKSDAQAAIWGGTAGNQYDPCYHQACDTYNNVADHALEVNSDLIAFSMLTYAFSTESVNGERGRSVPGRPYVLPAPAGEEGTFATLGGGAAADQTGADN